MPTADATAVGPRVETWTVAARQLDAARLAQLRAWWTARSLLWASLAHEPRTGDLAARSLEQLSSAMIGAEAAPCPWPTWDDRLTRLLRFVEQPVEDLLGNLRTSIRRTHRVRRPDQVRELDDRCMQWLGRQPGRHVREKIGLARGCLCLEREWTNELIENRVLCTLAKRLADLAGCYEGAIADPAVRALYDKARSWRTRMRRDGLADLLLTGPVTPNNVLLSHSRYGIIWRAWERLRGFDQLYQDDLEHPPATAWRDALLLRLAAELDRHPSVRLAHDYLEPPCVLRKGGAQAVVRWKTGGVRLFVLPDGGAHEYRLLPIGGHELLITERLAAGGEDEVIRLQLRVVDGEVSCSFDAAAHWHIIGPKHQRLGDFAAILAKQLADDAAESAAGQAGTAVARSIGACLLGAWPSVCSDAVPAPAVITIASGIAERTWVDDGGEERLLRCALRGRQLLDDRQDRWIRMADLLAGESVDPIALAPCLGAIRDRIAPAAGHVFAYGMPDDISEFRQAGLRSAVASAFRQPIPVWHSVAIAEALHARKAIEAGVDDLLVVVDLCGDRPCLTILTRAEDAWEHHQPIHDAGTEACCDHHLLCTLLAGKSAAPPPRRLVDEMLHQMQQKIPRPVAPIPAVASISRLSPGMQLAGRVRKVTEFGIFVDVGLQQNILIHTSKLTALDGRSPAAVFALAQPVQSRVLAVDVARNYVDLDIVEPVFRVQHLHNDRLCDITLSRERIDRAFAAGADTIVSQLRQLCASPRLRQLRKYLDAHRRIANVSVVIASVCAPERHWEALYGPVTQWASGMLSGKRQVRRCFVDQRDAIIAAGCQAIAAKRLAGAPTWYEWLPPLAFEVLKDGHFHPCVLIDGQRIQPETASDRRFAPVGGFTIPAGVREPRLPLLTGEFGELPFGVEARLRHQALPLAADCPCTLHLSYDYDSDSPYRLEFVPEQSQPGFQKLTAAWQDANLPTVRSLGYPTQDFWDESVVRGLMNTCDRFLEMRRHNGDCWGFLATRRNLTSFAMRQGKTIRDLPSPYFGRMRTIATATRDYLLAESRAMATKDVVNLAAMVEMLREDHEDVEFQEFIERMMRADFYHGLAICLPGNGQPFRSRWMTALVESIPLGGFNLRRNLKVASGFIPKFQTLALARALWRRPDAVSLIDADAHCADHLFRVMIEQCRYVCEAEVFDEALRENLGFCLEIILALCRRCDGTAAIAAVFSRQDRVAELLGLVKRADKKAAQAKLPCATKLRFNHDPPPAQCNMSPLAYNIVACLGGDQVGDLLEITDVG